MLRLTATRLIAGLVIVATVSALSFFTLYVRGGTAIARAILGQTATAEEVAAKAEALGLNRPLPEQFWSWATSAVRGDLGVSFASAQPVTDVLVTRLAPTMSIMVIGILLIAVVSAAVGIAAALRGGFVDRALQVISVIGSALPGFWVALVLVIAFAVTIKIFPATGFVPLSDGLAPWLASITLPVVAISIGAIAGVAQQVRGAMLDVMRQDFVRTLRSRGISERAVVFRHAFRNAAAPALTVLSFNVIGLLGGTVIIERIFAISGIGSLAVNAGIAGDVPVVMGVVLFMVLVVVVINLLVEIANGIITPKARAR